MSRPLRKPSTATVIASVALLVALGGTATAALSGNGGPAGSASPSAEPAAQFAPTQRGPRGPRGKRGPRGFRGPRGPAGPAGAAGAAGSALYFAHVLSTGALDATNSKTVTATNLARSGTGTYCFAGLNPAPRNAVATVGNTGTGSIVVVDLGQFGTCPAGTQITVRTFTNNGTTLSDTEFMIQLN